MDPRHLLLPLLLSACTSVDPWRHFPQHSRPSSAPVVPSAALPLPETVPDPQPPSAAPGPEPAEPGTQPRARKRRALPALITSMPPPPAPPPPVQSPVLPPASRADAGSNATPQPVIQCDALSCTTPAARVQGGTGNVHLDGAGRPCHVANGWLQCF